MKAKIIKTEEAYEKALAFVESLMDAKPGSKQEEELELWSLLIEQYEKECQRRFGSPIDPAV